MCAESAYDADGNLAGVGVMTKRLAPVNVGEVHFDRRLLRNLQGVQQRDRGVAVGAGIDDDAGRAIARFLDPGDELTLQVRLPEIDREAELRRSARAHLL